MMSRNAVCQGGRRKHTAVWWGGQRRYTAFMPLDLSTVVSGIGIIYAEQSDDKDVKLLKQKK